MIKAVIFDMDGLMVDSEPLHYKAFDEVFRKYGKHLTEKDNNDLYVGISDMDAAEDMVKRFGLPITAEELVLQKEVEGNKLLSSVTARPGLMELLNKLHKAGIKKAIASSSKVVIIEIVVKALGISNYIDAYCSAEHVKRGKPFPDLFLLAAKELDVNPKECLVLEDAPAGVKAARIAGMKVYAIPSKETWIRTLVRQLKS